MPLQRLGSVACELTDGPVVCFESSNDGCLLRSLIQTSPTGFALPPLARVTLVDVRAPGEWASPDGKAVSRTCFVCRVCYPYWGPQPLCIVPSCVWFMCLEVIVNEFP